MYLMKNNNYANFIEFLDNHNVDTPIVAGEYQILRQSIRDNYNRMHLNALRTTNDVPIEEVKNTRLSQFYSLEPIGEPHMNITSDICLNPIINSNVVSKPKLKKHIDTNVTSINDLLLILNENEYDDDTEYNIDLKALHNIKNELSELNNMIGISELKHSLLDQLLYFIQDLGINEEGGDYKHTVIYGPPGTGKTEIAKIIGKMYSKLGILKNNVFKKITRNDLIAGYLGQTAIKTKQIITECLGGVLFIDEAYSLGNSEGNDSFSKECLDTLCESLSDHKDDLMVIIAGYENEMNSSFFRVNRGLKSRFIWRFTIDSYTPLELMKIFELKVKSLGWNFENSSIVHEKWFNKRKDEFVNYGRDIEALFTYVKICHSRRIYGGDVEMRKILTLDDLEAGYQMLIANRDKKVNDFMSTLYV